MSQALRRTIANVVVEINPETPRRNSFEVSLVKEDGRSKCWSFCTAVLSQGAMIEAARESQDRAVPGKSAWVTVPWGRDAHTLLCEIAQFGTG